MSIWVDDVGRWPPDREQNRELQHSIHISHHSNNKSNVLPTFELHDLTSTLLLSTFFLFSKNVAKIKHVKTLFLLKNNKKGKTFFTSMATTKRIQKLQIPGQTLDLSVSLIRDPTKPDQDRCWPVIRRPVSNCRYALQAAAT